MVSELERVYSDGIMAKSLKEIGKKEWRMVLVSGSLLKVIFIKGNGHKIDKMELVCLSIVLVHTEDNL